MQEHGKRILLIEEDIEALTLIYTTLLPLDYLLEATLDVQEMKMRIERFQPNLILIGSTLATEAQMELLQWASRHFDAQVIIMGPINDVATPLYNQDYVADVLLKPVNAPQLLIKINNLLPV